MPIDTSIKEITPLIVNSFFSSSKDTIVVVIGFAAITPRPDLFILFDKNMNYIGGFHLDSNYQDYLYDDSAIFALKGKSIYRSRDLGRNFELIASPLSPSYYNNPNDYLSYSFTGKVRNSLVIYKYSPQNKWILFFDEFTLQIDSFEVTTTGLTFNKADSIFLFSRDNHLYFFQNIGNKIYLKNTFDTKSLVSEELLLDKFVEHNNISYLLLFKSNIGTSLIGDKIAEYYIVRIVPFGTNFLSVNYEPQENDIYIYIYSSLPFPNPSNSRITINLYWDNLGGSDNLNFSLYDVFGRPINIGKYDVIQTSSNSALVQFDFLLVQNGIYYLSISVGKKVISFPIVIAK